jgi:hypothetical protein
MTKESDMTKATERYLAFGFGVVFVIVLLLLAIKYPNPTPFQYTVFRIVLALAAGGVAAMIPGFLTIKVSTLIRGGGALAVFVVVYFYSPAELTGVKVKTEQEIEIDNPVVHGTEGSLPNLVVTKPDDLLNAATLGQRYQTLKIDGVAVKVPSQVTIVANEVEGLRGGAIVGADFSIVARRLANITVNASGGREPGTTAGTVCLYVKIVENARIVANGASGVQGQPGTVGANGSDGPNGRDGRCDGFGGYSGADAGGQGGDAGNGNNGQPGGNGQAGGLVAITTIVNPISSSIDVSGGQGGAGGAGGAAGTPGRGGTGGRGCTGIGGSQPNQADGRAGRPAQPGQTGQQGRAGSHGEYRLQIVKSFDPIVRKLKEHTNEQLHTVLLSP